MVMHSCSPRGVAVSFEAFVGVLWGSSHRMVIFFFVVALLFYVHGKHLRSCRDGQLT